MDEVLEKAEKLFEIWWFNCNFRWLNKAQTQSEAEIEIGGSDHEGVTWDLRGEGRTIEEAIEDLNQKLDHELI